MKRSSLVVNIPKSISKPIIHLGLSRTQTFDALWLIDIMIRKAKQQSDFHEFIPLAYNYWRKVFGSRYQEILMPLKHANILQAKLSGFSNKETYEPGKMCKSYRINPALLSSEFESIELKLIRSEQNDGHLLINNDRYCKEYLFNDFRELFIDFDKLTSLTENYVSSINRLSFKTGTDIIAQSFKVSDKLTGFNGYTTIESCLSIADRNSGTVIHDGNNFYVDDMDNFISQKKRNILICYEHCIRNLKNNNFYAYRNSTNDRLDHNFTALSKLLLTEIIASNDLVEIDLCNSQFAFLSHWMKGKFNDQEKPDLEAFYALTASGRLYEHLQEKLHLPDRNSAKELMMEIAFSSHKHFTKNKSDFRQIFPTVSAFADGIKVEGGSNSFAITLQRLESKLFIDQIYYRLKKAGYWLITRHDSLLVKKRDEKVVRSLLENYFKEIAFNCTLK